MASSLSALPPAVEAYAREAATLALSHKLLAVLVYILLHSTSVAVYRLWFHPLSRVPGPWWAAVSDIWIATTNVSGNSVNVIKDAHMKYGPILRVSPNTLSFATPTCYPAIHSTHPRRKQFPKSDFYDAILPGFTNAGIGSERDPSLHLQKLKYIAPSFSSAALKGYEPIMQKTLDLFLKEVEDRGTAKEGLDVGLWFCLLAFETTGQLVFGDGFGGFNNGEKGRWVSTITDSVDVATYATALKRFPPLPLLLSYLIPAHLLAAQTWHTTATIQKTLKRLSLPASEAKRDIISYILSSSKNISTDQLSSHASEIVIAGSESIATFMASTLWRLLKNPEILKELQQEIWSAFPGGEVEITAARMAGLKFLDAVVKEGTRIFPVSPTGSERVSLGETVDGVWIPAGVKVVIHAWTMVRSPWYFKNPDEFKPSRWLDPDCKDTLEASQPFSSGSRGCVGRMLGNTQMRLYLAKFIYRFDDIELVNPDQEWEKDCKAYMLWKKPALFMRLKRSTRERRGV